MFPSQLPWDCHRFPREVQCVLGTKTPAVDKNSLSYLSSFTQSTLGLEVVQGIHNSCGCLVHGFLGEIFVCQQRCTFLVQGSRV